ncbi:MAG TPA: VWA domain-containing protein, partial [Thermoanaerobaculia bacterium]
DTRVLSTEAFLKKTRATLALAAILLSIVAANAQEQTEIPKLVETVDVRVINVDVVVTDRKGNPINGLQMDDFEVYENRRPQKVTNFYEVRATEAPTPVEPAAAAPAPAAPRVETEEIPPHLRRRVIFYVDNLSMAPFNRNRVFQQMKVFAKDALRPGDEAMIVTWNRSMKIRVPFTNDAKLIEQQLDAIAGESALGIQTISERRSLESRIRDTNNYNEAIAIARQYSQSVEHDLRQSVSAINGLISMFAGLEGKKILVLTTEGFPIQPGREMFMFIEEMRREKQEWQASTSGSLESLSFESSRLIESIARGANANGITMYTLHAGGLAGGSEMSAENSQPIPYSVTQAALQNSTDSLHLMAEMTGGLAIVGTNNFKDGFKKIGRDLQSYYSLGYRSGTERVDRQRQVEVRVKNRNYVVRSRRSFVEKSVPTEMSDRVIANLFYPTSTNDLKITVTTGLPVRQEDGNFQIPVDVHIPMESLTFLPQGEMMLGGFSVFVAAANKAGDMSDVSRRSQQVRLKPDEMPTIKGKHYTYQLELLVEKGPNKISVGVIDEIANLTGFDRREVLAADLR